MEKFKVGDRVRGTSADIKDGEYIIEYDYGNGKGYKLRCTKDGKFEHMGSLIDRGADCNWGACMELITSTNTKSMTSVKAFIKKVSRKQPEKAFVEAGFMDENENITEKGREALELVLWDANKEAIKKIADQIIAAEEKK